ncbi:potassium channel family protein [Pontixanthobacter sp. CEM42]|uniref:potassium channel family protein n=1 Tax=Pontixanthobacter sp. CEM42 TaxID=2792077 RepID=UPI001ADFB401|nr:potassium channel family protein [Pontixanthobacter sp. CEM42]
MFIGLTISLVLIGLTILIHYEVLRQTSIRLVDLPIPARARILVVLTVATASHTLHIVLYAMVYMWLHANGQYGDIGGSEKLDFAEAFYFSITSYTTLGIGDLFPHGALRTISGLEALNGLVMVGWTASYTYLAMEKFWHLSDDDDD